MRSRLSINISVARSCFVRCHGCYNHVGDDPKPLTTAAITAFLRYAKSMGLDKVTLCGGDPLSRPGILDLVQEIKELGFYIQLDTVGTPLLGDTQSIFFGNISVAEVDAQRLAALVDLIGIPIDGASNEVQRRFRKGRTSLLDEQLRIVQTLDSFGANICVNTVVHKGNMDDVLGILDLLRPFPHITKWQAFQFMPIGTLGYRNRERYAIDDDLFESLRSRVDQVLEAAPLAADVEFKARRHRKGNYLLIDSDGSAWVPKTSLDEEWHHREDATNERLILGNISDPNNHAELLRVALNPRTCLSALLETTDCESHSRERRRSVNSVDRREGRRASRADHARRAVPKQVRTPGPN